MITRLTDPTPSPGDHAHSGTWDPPHPAAQGLSLGGPEATADAVTRFVNVMQAELLYVAGKIHFLLICCSNSQVTHY